MTVLYLLSDFIDSNVVNSLSPSYYYEDRSAEGELLRLPRTLLAETIAHSLMQHLPKNVSEGKMYGVLLVELPTGEQRVLKAFSGLLNGSSLVEGWVPPISGRSQVFLEEACTLVELERLKQELTRLKQLPERQQYEIIQREFELRRQEMVAYHQHCKHKRDEQRQLLGGAIEHLDEESRQQGMERRQLKRQRDRALQPLKELIVVADMQMSELKQRRRALSRQLQAQMYAAYSLTNFLGQSLSLQQLIPSMPTGTGDCCAIKLLHYAATHDLTPLAMAEFWWGLSTENKIQGEFYGACKERCQPLMGFLLSGLPQYIDIKQDCVPIIYEDEWLIAVNKPAGLLSVPGRYRDHQDSVLSRLQHLSSELMAVHRLDRDTSGILLLARDRSSHRQLSLQFQQRQVNKVYEALLSGLIATNQGKIELPISADLQNRPTQKVNWQQGKPSLTHFQVIAREGNYTRIKLIPLTGRTHQLRVHAADPQGLGVPILGDCLYGCRAVANRLHLHAKELCFEHPQSQKTIHLQVETPF